MDTPKSKTRDQLIMENNALQKQLDELREVGAGDITKSLLQEKEELYKKMFNSSRDAIMTIEPPSWKFSSGNPAYLRLFGIKDAEELKLYGPWDISPEKQADGSNSSDRAEEMIRLALDKGSNFFEWIHKRKNGEEFPATVLLTKVELKNITFLQATVRDITESKQAEEAIQHQNILLQERNRELDDFSHTVAHDLKNPIGTIMSFAELLNDKFAELPEKEIRNFLKIIMRDASKAHQIIDSLLLFASVKETEIETEEINMYNIVTDTIDRLTPMIENGNVEIKRPGTWPATMAYAPWIEEVWVNYLSNAIKYSGTSSQIEIGFDTRKSENVQEGMIRFWVRDNGPGISAGNQKRLFKKFERLDQVKTEGYGLGLSIVHRIINKLGGQVGVESEIDKGSLFYFTLPYSE